MPVAVERSRKAHGRLDGAVLLGIADGGEQVAVVALKAGEPCGLVRTTQERLHLLGQRQDVGGVPTPHRAILAKESELPQPEIVDCLQHPEAHLAMGKVLLHHETRIHERGEAVEDSDACSSLPIATASAASSVQPPTKAVNRRKRR
jgi:hypothetical protein